MLLAIWAGFTPVAADDEIAGHDPVQIIRLPPDPRGGQAYRLTYVVRVPLDIFWRFKTDFDNTFLETNRYILSHRLISREKDVVVTEDRYSNLPDVVFRWQTRMLPEKHRLEYHVLSTNQPGYKFHYGFIQLQAQEETTLVKQEAYFDFSGASLWSIYPWRGGMWSFLEYTAKWEQRTAVRLRHLFTGPEGK